MSAVFLAACAAFTKTTPVAVIVTLLLIGGFFRSLQFTCINTIAYAEIEPDKVSRATSLITVSRQLALSAGVAFGALVVELVVRFRGGGPLIAADFSPAFLAIAVVSVFSLLFFVGLPADAGAELSGRKPSDV